MRLTKGRKCGHPSERQGHNVVRRGSVTICCQEGCRYQGCFGSPSFLSASRFNRQISTWYTIEPFVLTVDVAQEHCETYAQYIRKAMPAIPGPAMNDFMDLLVTASKGTDYYTRC